MVLVEWEHKVSTYKQRYICICAVDILQQQRWRRKQYGVRLSGRFVVTIKYFVVARYSHIGYVLFL